MGIIKGGGYRPPSTSTTTPLSPNAVVVEKGFANLIDLIDKNPSNEKKVYLTDDNKLYRYTVINGYEEVSPSIEGSGGTSYTGKVVQEGATPPSDTAVLWVDTSNNSLKRHNGTRWVSVAHEDFTSIIDDRAVIGDVTRTYSIAKLLATFANIDHTHTADDLADFSEKVEEKIASLKGVAGGIATIGEDGLIPLSQLPKLAKETIVAENIEERDAISGEALYEGLLVYVADATGDSTVISGGAFYIYNGTTFSKFAESESLEAVIIQEWSEIIGRPISTVGSIDQAVTNSHTHDNAQILNHIGEIEGRLAYYGNKVITEKTTELVDMPKASEISGKGGKLLALKSDETGYELVNMPSGSGDGARIDLLKQSEYDSLSDGEKMDGTIYFIY